MLSVCPMVCSLVLSLLSGSVRGSCLCSLLSALLCPCFHCWFERLWRFLNAANAAKQAVSAMRPPMLYSGIANCGMKVAVTHLPEPTGKV